MLLTQSNIALGAGPGTIKWSYPVDQVNHRSVPAIGHNGTIYIPDGNKLLAINPNGTLKWIFDTGISDAYVGIPSVDSQDNIYFVVVPNDGDLGGYIYALNSNKSLLWTKELYVNLGQFGGGAGYGEISIGLDSTIYAVGRYRMQAFTPAGQPKWVANHGMGFAPAISQYGNIFDVLLEINPVDGSVYNSSGILDVHPNGPVLGINSDIYIASDGQLSAYRQNLTLFWRNPSGGISEPPVIDVDGTIYYTSRDGSGYYFDAVRMNGTQKFKHTYYPPNTTVVGTPAIGNNGYIYVPSVYEGLVAFNNAGDVQWHTGGAFQTQGKPATAILGSNGTIYIIGYVQEQVPIGQPIPVHYSLYAIESSSTGPAASAWPMYGANAQHTHVVSDVSALTPIITSITPTLIPVNQPVTFTVAGVNLPDGLSFNLPSCSPAPEQHGGTATQRQFVCTPTQTGTLTAEVKDAQGNVVSGGSAQVTVSATAPTITSITPTVVTQNVPATFTVVGTNLPDGLSFNLPGCSPAPEQPGGTATQRQFVCTPKLPDILTATVKDAQGNTVSGGTTMIVINLNWREVNPPSAATPTEIAKESQYIVLVTHGWNSSAEVWPNKLVRLICDKLGGRIQDGEAAGKNDSITGIDQYCYAGPDNNLKKWLIASYNWKHEADTGIIGCGFHLAIGCPSVALRNAEMLGKAWPILVHDQWQYMHLIGHSAGSGLIQQFASSVKKEQPAIKIHMTLLDSFCPDTKSCSYGEGVTWAEQYFDARDLDETEVKLISAYNFNITALDQYGIYPGIKDVHQHAFPYKYYIATAGGTPDTFKARIENDKPFGANLAGWMLEWVAWYQNKNSYPLEKLKEDQERYGRGYCKLQDEEGLGLSKCKDQWGEPVYTYTPRSFESQMTDDQCPAELTANGTWFQATVTAKTCLSGQQAQATGAVKLLDATTLPDPGMALLRVTLSGPANRLSFDYRFTEEGADGALQVFIDNDELAYVTTQALDGVEWRHAGRIDIPTLAAGEHALRIVVKALNSHNAGVEVTHILYEEAQSQAVPVPATPVITSGPTGTVNTTSATFTFTGEAGVTFECGVDSGAYQACASHDTGIEQRPASFRRAGQGCSGEYRPGGATELDGQENLHQSYYYWDRHRHRRGERWR